MSTNKHVSVIISNFNGAEYLPRLLETLRSQSGVEVEIIVVDRNSIDDSASMLASMTDVQLIQEPPESGLVSGYAVGAERASADLLFFCNEDMWFDSDCLSELALHVDLDERICAADPWQWTYDGRSWIHGGVRFSPTILDVNLAYPFRAHRNCVVLPSDCEVPFGCAGAILIHRTAYEAVGGWDRSFFLDHEDVDLLLRLWRLDWKCVTVPTAHVYHAVGVSNAKTTAKGSVSRRRYISGRSSLLIMGVKHFSSLAMCLPFFVYGLIIAKHLTTLRLQRAWWCVLAFGGFWQRLPGAIAYRRANTKLILENPGQDFFKSPTFQYRPDERVTFSESIGK